MTKLSIELGPIFSALDKGLLVLTPNHRTSVQLLEAYGEFRRQKKLALVCASPNIFPVDIWVRQKWEELSNKFDSPVQSSLILNASQELLLWQEVILNSSTGSKLLNQQATARSAQDAYRLLLQWQIPVQELHIFSTSLFLESAPYEDVEVFVQWLADYEKRLAKDNSINLSQLLPQFIAALENGYVQVPKQILLLGFNNPPPLYQTLFKAIEKNNTDLNWQGIQHFSPRISQHSFNNSAQEMLNAARWSKDILDQNGSAKIGIICPDLHSRSSEIQRVFSNCFYPDNMLSAENNPITTFSTTTSATLSSLPMIETAFSLFGLNEQTLPTLDICLLLRSPYIEAADQEADSRAALELCLRKKTESQCSLADLRYLANQADKPWHCPILAKALIEISLLHKRNQTKRSTTEWVTLLEQLLKLCDWPSREQLSLVETQGLDIWHEMLKEFSELGYICGKIDFHSALKLLQQLAHASPSTHFYNQAKVQILSPIEAAGLQFTHLWFMGLSEQAWPQSSRPNPFIPLKIQKKYQLLDACPDLQYHFARDTLHSFKHCTQDEIIFSYPLLAEDISLKPSILLEEFKQDNSISEATIKLEDKAINIPNLHPLSQHLLDSSKNDTHIEDFQEPLNIPFQDGENRSGGSRIIADQADCPFRNFALQRLHAQELPKLSFGLPAFEIGNMLHYAMELMWQGLKNQDSIKQLNSVQKAQLTQTAASTAVKATAQRFPQTMTPQYTQLEISRLGNLLQHWLEEEIKRDFFTVVKHEYAIQWQHSSLQLNLRIDRIEQFSDNSYGVVDYKSSKNNNSINWLDPRQNKPQLLLYLQALEQTEGFSQISSLLFAQVNIEEMKYKGLTETDTSYPGLAFERQKQLAATLSWQELKLFWQTSLQELAQEFLEGYLAVTPKTNSSCNYCHLPSLCRIQETRKKL